MSNYYILDHYEGTFQSFDYGEDAQMHLFMEYKLHTFRYITERYTVFKGSDAVEIKAITRTQISIGEVEDEEFKTDSEGQTTFL